MITNLLLGGALLASPLPSEYNTINQSRYSIGSVDLGISFDVMINQTIDFFINENNEMSGISFDLILEDNLVSGFSGSSQNKIVSLASIFEQNIPFNNLINFTTRTSISDVSRNSININQNYYISFQNNDTVTTWTNTLYWTMSYSAPIEGALTFETTNENYMNINFFTGENCPVCAPCAPCENNFFSWIKAMFNSTITILNFEIFEGFKIWYILGIPLFISLIFGVLKLLR